MKVKNYRMKSGEFSFGFVSKLKKISFNQTAKLFPIKKLKYRGKSFELGTQKNKGR